MDSTEFTFFTPIQVRFADMDAMGHVNNAMYLTYFEQARVEYLRALTKRNVDESMDESFILAEVHVVFRAPSRVGETLHAYARISRIGTKSFDFAYRITNSENKTLICEGSSVQVMYDYVRKKTIPIPDDFVRRVEEFEGHPVARS